MRRKNERRDHHRIRREREREMLAHLFSISKGTDWRYRGEIKILPLRRRDFMAVMIEN